MAESAESVMKRPVGYKIVTPNNKLTITGSARPISVASFDLKCSTSLEPTDCVWIDDLVLGIDVDFSPFVLPGLDGQEEQIELSVADIGDLETTFEKCDK